MIFWKKLRFLILFIYGCLALNQAGAQTTFASKKIYLVDSLQLSDVSGHDLQLLDSCLKLYHNAKNDTARLFQLNTLANKLEDDRLWPAYAFVLKDEVEKALKKKDNPEAVTKRLNVFAGSAAHFLGYYYLQIVRNDSISEIYNKASIVYHSRAGRKKSVANDLLSLAGNYSNQGKVTEAMSSYQQALSIFTEEKDTSHSATCLQNIGYLLMNQNDFSGALKYFKQAMFLYEKINHEHDKADCLNFIASCYKGLNDFPSAVNAYNEAEKIYRSVDDEYGLATILLNRGELFMQMGDDEAAFSNFKTSLELFERSGDKNPISFALNDLAACYLKKGDLKNARLMAERSFALAQEMRYPDNLRNSAKILSSIYKQSGEFKKALDMHELYSKMNDSILNADTKRNTIEKELKYQHDRELLELQKQREKEALLAVKEKEKRNIVIASVSVGLLLVCLFLLFLYNRFRVIRRQKNIIELQKNEVEEQKEEIENQKNLVENKNHEILDSITYARRLQQAILPQEKTVLSYLPESFVLYKPKDIVAGDFYWIEKVGDEVIVAVADCTGHGVPGAMVSFVCVNALNRAVLEYGLTSPARILDKVSELVIKAFERSENEVKDGMDIAICTFNTKTRELHYAGAYNPLWILRKEATDIEEIKGTRQAIGNVAAPVPFQNNELRLETGDIVYLFSDGYADQFGGAKGKKLKYKSFAEILLQQRQLPLGKYADALDSAFEDWKGTLEQVDDICVLGFKVSAAL
jgi:serine phosphatase RsbU (regulator of sigma subunit)/predicted negative regulator of RcsB-dependent stress response